MRLLLLVLTVAVYSVLGFQARFIRVKVRPGGNGLQSLRPQASRPSVQLHALPQLRSLGDRISVGGIGRGLSGLLDGMKRLLTFASLALSFIFCRVLPGVATAFLAVPQVANAGILRRYNNLSPMQKLATTPLFFVCNSGGSPYLQEDIQAGKPTQRIIVYFMSSEDANDYLNEMAQGSPQNVNEFRLKTTSMEKVMNNIQRKKQSRKLGRFPVGTVYRIQPSSRQCENAERVASGGGRGKSAAAAASLQGGAAASSSLLKGLAIPMFTAKGLAIQRSSGELVTPYYFAYEDLLDDWSKLSSAAASSSISPPPPAAPKVIVKDVTEVLCLAQGITAESIGAKSEESGGKKKGEEAALDAEEAKFQKTLESVGIVPPRREIEMVRSYYRGKAGIKGEFGRSRLMGAPR